MKLTLLIIGVVAVIYLNISIFLLRRDKAKYNKEIKDRLKDRIWDIPVELQCQYCKETSEHDFSLETSHFKCPHCGKENKILIQFITVAEDPTWKNDEITSNWSDE